MGVNLNDALQEMALDAGLEFDKDSPIVKEVMSTSTANFGGKLPREAVLQLIDQTMAQSAWTASLRTQTVTRQKGTIPIMDFTKRTLFPAVEDSNLQRPRGAGTTNVEFSCKGARSDLYITIQELREARALGISDFAGAVRAAWTKQLNNDLADMIINGNEALASSYTNDTELSRSVCNGILKLTDTGAQIVDRAGVVFNKKLFSYARYLLPARYHSDPGLRWFLNGMTDEAWADAVGHQATPIPGLSADALTSWRIVPPLGIEKTMIPQIETVQGPSADADDAVDAGSAAKIQCDTAFRGYASGHAGRRVKVTYKVNGEIRFGTVADDTSHLEFTASDYFGLAAIDTVHGNYKVEVYDETTLMLLNPSNIIVFFLDAWDSYQDFDSDYRRWHIKTFIDLDIAVITAAAIVKLKGIQLPAVDPDT